MKQSLAGWHAYARVGMPPADNANRKKEGVTMNTTMCIRPKARRRRMRPSTRMAAVMALGVGMTAALGADTAAADVLIQSPMVSVGASTDVAGGSLLNAGQTAVGTASNGNVILRAGAIPCLAGSGGPACPPIEIVHGAAGVSFGDQAFSGYIDPRCDEGTPPFCYAANRLDRFTIAFNVVPFGDEVGGPVTPANVTITQTGGSAPPNVVGVVRNGASLQIQLDRPITAGEWTTIRVLVYNACAEPIVDLGNQGPGIDEPDRIDVAALPGDIDQTGRTLPLDNTRFRLMYAGRFHNPRGVDADYADITRDGRILPFDLTVWRLRYNTWLSGSLPARP